MKMTLKALAFAAALSYFFCDCAFAQLVSQVRFHECEKEQIQNVVLDFVEKREAWTDFLVLATATESQEFSAYSNEDSFANIMMMVAENTKAKMARRDCKKLGFMQNKTAGGAWITIVNANSTQRVYANSQPFEVPPGGSFQGVDPWNLTFCTLSSVESGKCSPIYWRTAFEESNLVACEKSEKFYRAEWRYGKPGKVYSTLMVYFDKDVDYLPSFARFHVPGDLAKPFCADSKEYRQEVRTKWKKVAENWIPSTVSIHFEQYGGNNKVTILRDVEFQFSSHGTCSQRDGLFDVESTSPQKLYDSLIVERESESSSK